MVLGKFGKKFLKNYSRIRSNSQRKRQLFSSGTSRKYKKGSNGPDENYGLAEPLIEELLPNDLEKKKKAFLISLENENLQNIEINTRNQNDSEKWYNERKKRLTASKFGQVCKMRANTSCKNVVYSILYSTNVQSKSIQYGHDTEFIAREEAEKIIGEKIQRCGLIVDPDVPYLAASPGKIY